MGWTWYLGDDMIFFLVSMGILPFYTLRPALGWILISSLSVISLTLTSWLILSKQLGPYPFMWLWSG